MSIKITYEFEDTAAAVAFMELSQHNLPSVPVESRPFEHAIKSRDELRAEQNATACDKPDLPKAEREARKTRAKKTPPAEPVPAEPVTAEHARLALTERMAAKGMAACTKVLEDAGVKRISEITDYAGFVAACKAIA